jgi:type IV pilus assembly protein PilY1
VLSVAIAAAIAWSAQVEAQECNGDSQPRAPVSVAYGDSGSAHRVSFTPSDDGTLRAIDADSGETIWTFTVEEAGAAKGAGATSGPDTASDAAAARGPGVASVGGGLMTDIRVLRFDANRDGTIDLSSGDKVWLYFGARRGGPVYYALDVTDRSGPRVLWKIGPDVLEGAGEAWSTPTIARVRVAGATQNGEHFVLVIGGGYDKSANHRGHRIFMVDAATGHLLWFAGGPGGVGTPDRPLRQMNYPVPARVAALDTDADGFADRLYAADLGGQVWRFDIWNGHSRSELITGGVLASLGADLLVPHGAQPPASEDGRRFFNAPDVALMQRRGADPYYNIAIGSGDRASPGAATQRDRFYSIRDRHPFTRLAQSSYEAAKPILDSDLVDITVSLADSRVPPEASGWKMDLRLNGGWSGEKVLAESLTVNGIILFTTYQPLATASTATCAVGGSSRVYALNVDTGNAALDLNSDERITADDVSMKLTQIGIPGELRIEIPSAKAGPSSSPAESPNDAEDDGPGAHEPPRSPTRCLVGAEVLSRCVPIGTVIRTFWQRRSIN